MEYKNSFLNTKLTKLYEANCLVGNWVEDRFGKEIETEKQQKEYCSSKSETEQTSSYKEYSNILDIINYNFILNHRNKKRATMATIKFCDSDSEAFFNNFTRSSDLHYTYIPRTTCSPLPKTHEPRPDFLASYGNLSKFGIRKYYEIKNFMDNRASGLSETRDTFTCHDNKYYKPNIYKKGPTSTIKHSLVNYLT